MTGDIMNISRLRMGTDGVGVSTLVAFFGCPLRCRYCVNDACHDRGGAFPETPRGAYEAGELVRILEQDAIYFLMSGGGVAFGGGEPLLQAEFIKEVCALADKKWKFRIETSLYAPWEKIAMLADAMDEWIVDIKEMNPAIYKAYTGKSNLRAVINLKKLWAAVPADKVRVRLPRIPAFNSREDMNRSVAQLKQLGVTGIDEFDYIAT